MNYDKKINDLCGDAVVDFVNANSTDEACLSLIPKIQKYYRFSPNFINNAQDKFPSIEHISNDSSPLQRSIVDLHIQYWTESALIEEAVWNLGLLFDDYDLKGDRLILQEEWKNANVRIPLKDANKNYQKIEKKITDSCPVKSLVDSWKNTLQGFELKDHISNIRRYAELFFKATNDISKEQDNEIEILFENDLLIAHRYLNYKQEVIKIVINRALNGIRLDRCVPFTGLISDYQNSQIPSIEILQKGNLKFDGPAKSEKFFTQYYESPSKRNVDRDYNGVGAKILKAYASAIDEFFVEFLKPYNNIRRLNYCKNCCKFFVSLRKRKSIYCSKKCRQDWHNRERIESGEHKRYKRKKRAEGAKESYYE